MVDVANKYIVKIEDYDSQGNGVSRIDDLVVFVPNTIVGEIVEICIEKVNKNFLRGRVNEVLSVSESRVLPICEIYEKCG